MNRDELVVSLNVYLLCQLLEMAAVRGSSGWRFQRIETKGEEPFDGVVLHRSRTGVETMVLGGSCAAVAFFVGRSVASLANTSELFAERL